MVETDRYNSFFETDTDISKKIFTDICPAADIRLATDIIFKNLPTDTFAGILTKYFG